MTLLSAPPTRFHGQMMRHIERTIGPSPMVFHEIMSPNIHLDLHVVPPQAEGVGGATAEHPHGRDFFTIVTSGMSTRPMNAAAQAEAEGPGCARYAELMVTLPADWPGLRRDGTFVQEYMQEEANWWPIRWLKALARMPHEEASCVSAGQVIPNGAEGERLVENTGFGGVMLLESVLHPRAQRLVVHDDRVVEFLALWPLYPEEMELASQVGAEGMRRALARAGVTDLVDVRRRNVARERAV